MILDVPLLRARGIHDLILVDLPIFLRGWQLVRVAAVERHGRAPLLQVVSDAEVHLVVL